MGGDVYSLYCTPRCAERFKKANCTTRCTEHWGVAMNEKLHAKAAGHYYKIAGEYDSKYAKETDDVEKTALMIVAAQNYFYAAINIIEALLARKELHSFSHENRVWKVLENKELFTDEIMELFELVDRNQRNKVTYRGENGQKYTNIRKLAGLLRSHYE